MLRLGEDEDDDEIEDDFNTKPDQPETNGGAERGGDEGNGGAGEGDQGAVGVRRNFRKPRRGLRIRRRVNSFRVRGRRTE